MKRTSLAAMALLATVAVLIAASPAAAATASDPKDVDGKLDIVKLRYDQSEGGSDIFTIETEDGWKCKYLKSSKNTRLQWKFDDSDDGDADYKGNFVCRDGTLTFEMKSTDGQNQYEPLFPEKPDDKTVELAIPGGFFTGDTLDAWATSKDGEAEECSTPCADRGPDEGSLKAY